MEHPGLCLQIRRGVVRRAVREAQDQCMQPADAPGHKGNNRSQRI